MTTGKAEKAEIIKIMEFPNGRNIVHIPIRTPEEEARHHEELYKAAVRLLKAQERSKKRTREGSKIMSDVEKLTEESGWDRGGLRRHGAGDDREQKDRLRISTKD